MWGLSWRDTWGTGIHRRVGSRRCWGSGSGSPLRERKALGGARGGPRGAPCFGLAGRGGLRGRQTGARQEPGQEASVTCPDHGLWDHHLCFSDSWPRMATDLHLAPRAVLPTAAQDRRFFLSFCSGNCGTEGLSPQHVREEARSAPTGRPRPCRVVSEPHGVENPPNLFGKPAS